MRRKLLVTLGLVLALMQLYAQELKVSGTVTDEQAKPVVGASVIVKGTNTGVSTDEKGKFTIGVPTGKKTIVISSIGFVTQELTAGTAPLNITLKAGTGDLQEIVVVGYGTQQKTSFTGSSSKIDAKEFSNLVTPSIDKQLAGRATGVQVTNSSGLVNQPARIIVRGVNSISQGTGPLIVLDGVPMISGNLAATTNSNALGDINPSDIESIDILKDGAATAIFGSRGASGVIMITTKKGTKGKVRVNYDGFVGFSNPLKKWDLLNAEEFVTIANEKLANAGLAARAFMDAEKTNTDWQNEALINNALVQNHTISLQGGGNKTTYYFSANYSDQQGTIKSNYNRAYRLRFNIDHEVNQYVKIGNNLTVSRQEDADQNNGSNSLSGAIASTLRLLPNVSPYSTTTATGYNITYPAANAMFPGANTQSIDDNFTNVAFTLNKNKYSSDKYRVVDNMYLEISPLPGLKIRSVGSADMFSDYSFQQWDPRHGDGYSSLGYVYNATQNYLRYVWQNYFNYNLKLKDHSIFLTGGHELQSQTNKWVSGSGTNVSDLFFQQANLITNTPSTPNVGGSYSKSGFESLYGRINYDFKNRYFAFAAIRRDGQSSLAADKRYGMFPGFSAGWRPSEEGFWKKSKFMTTYFTDVKIKGSYAKVGTTLSGFPYLSTFGPAPYGNVSGLAVTNIGNSNLQWETSTKYDVGVELGLLRNRISLTADWFMNDVDNLVLDVPTPFSAGIPGNTISQNIGKLKNKGIELSVNAQVVSKKNFFWTVNANYSKVNNEIVSLYAIGGNPVKFIQNGNYNLIQVNAPINIIYGYQYAGVNSANGNPMYYKADGTLVQQNFRTGGSIGAFYTANGKTDGTLGAATSMAFADRQQLGYAVPTWFGAVTNTFDYKGLSLEFMLRYSGGNKIMNTTRQEALSNQSFQNNGKEILNRWTTPGQETSVPRLYYGQGNNINQNTIATSRFVESGDYLRLQNVVLSYTLNRQKLIQATNGYIQNVRIYVQGQNLKVWTKYTGSDPDNITSLGVDASVSPQISTVSFGVNLGF